MKRLLACVAIVLFVSAAILIYRLNPRSAAKQPPSTGNVLDDSASESATRINSADTEDSDSTRAKNDSPHPLLGTARDAVLADGHDRLSTADEKTTSLIRRIAEQMGNGGDPIKVDYPLDESIFPPEIVAPVFLWHDDNEQADSWLFDIAFEGDTHHVYGLSRGAKPAEGPIDRRCVAATNEIYRPTSYQAAAKSWQPSEELWNSIKQRSTERKTRVTIVGFSSRDSGKIISRGGVTMRTSKDPVGAPIFYRDVPLAPSRTRKGVIKPLGEESIPLIAWRLREISRPESRLLLTGVRTCTNCHSFSSDGKTLGLDVDGPKGDKGSYAIVPVRRETSIDRQHVISWNSYPGKPKDHKTIGFLSQVSPDGQFVVTTLNESVFVWNFLQFDFLQVFYPTRGILGYYRRSTGEIKALPGADDAGFVHCDPAWTPDSQQLVFARAEARDAYNKDGRQPKHAGDSDEVQIQYDLYRIPFHDGKGGTAEPIEGASHNGMSNTFPKVSPDGKWVVFVKCRNGQLMRPDSTLWIVPIAGGSARKMRCNTSRMNSWHSFSPNGRWMVFSSKVNTPYTQMFLTHLDESGNDSPPILIPNSTAANRAVNLPEFANVAYDDFVKIDAPAVEYLNLGHRGGLLLGQGKLDEALACFEKAVASQPDFLEGKVSQAVVLIEQGKLPEAKSRIESVLAEDPQNAFAHANLGVVLAKTGKMKEAVAEFETAADLNPDDQSVQVSAGRACLAIGNLDAALGHLVAALEIAPNDPLRHFDVGNVLFQMGKLDEAIVAYETAVEKQPKFVDALLNLATVLTSKGRFAAAVERLKQARETAPNHPAALNSLALLLAACPDSSVRDGATAVKLLEPVCQSVGANDPMLLSTLAAGYAEQARWTEALAAAEKALKLVPPDDEFLRQRLRQEIEAFQGKKPYRLP